MAPDTDPTSHAWWAVAGVDAGDPDVEVTGSTGSLPSHLAVEPVAVACVAAALLAAARLEEQSTGRLPTVALDREHVAMAVRSERWFSVDDAAPGGGFAPLSRFWPSADGWVRTHANFAWHRRALTSAVGLPDTASADDLGARLASLPGQEIEDAVVAAGGVTARVRSAAEWSSSPQGRGTAAEDLVGLTVAAAGAARLRRTTESTALAAGLRVLDLTRVIAGPVCTRFLGALGADVLRVDPPQWPDLVPGQLGDTILGKRSAALDLDSPAGVERLHALLEDADVLVCGYRPGGLDRFGLGDADLVERHPGLVTVRLDAWGHAGPWSQRRGFDSVVQAGIGIARAEADPDDPDATPGALPCQLLDHGTGYLAAAAALDGVRRQRESGGTILRRLSLARTGQWLLAATPDPLTDSEGEPRGAVHARLPHLSILDAGGHRIRAVAPPGTLDGAALRWPARVTRYVGDEPVWARS